MDPVGHYQARSSRPPGVRLHDVDRQCISAFLVAANDRDRSYLGNDSHDLAPFRPVTRTLAPREDPEKPLQNRLPQRRTCSRVGEEGSHKMRRALCGNASARNLWIIDSKVYRAASIICFTLSY